MNRLWRAAGCVILAATVMLVPRNPAAARDDANAKLVVGYVAAVSVKELVIVLSADGYPGQKRGMQVRFAMTPGTRVLDRERPATADAIAVRREATVTYDEANGANVAREVRLLGALPAGVAMPSVPAYADAQPAPDAARRPPDGLGRGEAWRTSYDAFVSELQRTVQSQGLNNSELAARFGGQRVTWDGEFKGLIARDGQGILLEIGFPQRRLRLRDGSAAFIGFVINTAGTHIKTTDSKAVTAILISASVLPTAVNVPDILRVSFVLKRVWIQPPDPGTNPKLGNNSVLAIATESPQLMTKLVPKEPGAR